MHAPKERSRAGPALEEDDAIHADLDERAAILALVAQPTRLRLFYLLDTIGEVCVCDLGEILGIAQPAVSQHLAKFKAYGLVSVRRENQTLFYGLSDYRTGRR